MKKNIILLVVISLLYTTAVFSQTERGNIIVGLSTHLNLSEYNSGFGVMGYSEIEATTRDPYTNREVSSITDQFGLSVNPKVGYFVEDNFALGLSINSIYSKSEGENDYEEKISIIAAGPFLRYYLMSGKIMPYFEIEGTFGKWKDNREGGMYSEPVEDKTSIYSFGGGLGLAFLLGERLSFDMQLAYNRMVMKDNENAGDNNRIIFDTVGLNLGFNFIFGTNE